MTSTIEDEKLYVFPPGHTRASGEWQEFSETEVKEIISAAPQPTSRKRKGRRPHRYDDLEGEFRAESEFLEPLIDASHPEPHPRMWMLPAVSGFNYKGQNKKGKPKMGEAGPDPGKYRIVIDKNRNVLGMACHVTMEDVEKGDVNKEDFERLVDNIKNHPDSKKENGKRNEDKNQRISPFIRASENYVKRANNEEESSVQTT